MLVTTTAAARKPAPTFPLRWAVAALLVVAGIALLTLSGYVGCVQEETERQTLITVDNAGTRTALQPQPSLMHEMQVCFKGEKAGPPDQLEDLIPSHAVPVSVAAVLILAGVGVAGLGLPGRQRSTGTEAS